jgi:hypothetical protein
MKNSFLVHEDWSCLSTEPSKSGSSSIHFTLTHSPQTISRWFALFLSFRTFLAGQQSKLTEKLENSALVVNELEELEFSFKKSKFKQILKSEIFGWLTIKTNGKTQKLSSKHVTGGERVRRAGIFFEINKISADSELRVQNLERTNFNEPKSSFSWRPTTFVLNYCKKNRFPTSFETLAGHESKFGVFWPKKAIFEVSAPGFNLHRSQRFFYMVTIGIKSNSFKTPRECGKLDLKNDRPP